MKHTHILNIGYPKCGTTWLWNTLLENNSIAYHHEKENISLFTGTPVVDYCNQYAADVTANFCTGNIALDRYVIKQLAQVPQIRVSIILRDPTQLLWSTYNFLKISNFDFDEWCYQMIDTKWFINSAQIISRWQHSFDNRFNVFWYDDLKRDNKKFYYDYCQVMELDPGPAIILPKNNVTAYKGNIPELDQDLVDLLKLQFMKLMIYK